MSAKSKRYRIGETVIVDGRALVGGAYSQTTVERTAVVLDVHPGNQQLPATSYWLVTTSGEPCWVSAKRIIRRAP